MDGEQHYVAYDPDQIWQAMMEAYVAAGGDLLYGGDEKEMLLRAVQSVLVQACAGVDAALKQATLRYAEGEKLDLYGDKRNCARIEAQAARAEIEITFKEGARARTIPEGYAVSSDGVTMYLLTEDIEYTGAVRVFRTEVICQQTGVAGNSLTSGTQMQFLRPQEGVQSVYCVEDASGGQERETDDVYRERIREYSLANVTTGPRIQYESVAKGVTSEIIDAAALNTGAGQVTVYLLLAHDEGAAAIIQNVTDALNGVSVRPLTDQVTVTRCTDIEYEITAQYSLENTASLTDLQAAVAEYQEWQDNEIGQAFNPDRLMALLYRAGAARVVWKDGSHFGTDGAIEYTLIQPNERCKGTIVLEAL